MCGNSANRQERNQQEMDHFRLMTSTNSSNPLDRKALLDALRDVLEVVRGNFCTLNISFFTGDSEVDGILDDLALEVEKCGDLQQENRTIVRAHYACEKEMEQAMSRIHTRAQVLQAEFQSPGVIMGRKKEELGEGLQAIRDWSH